MMKKKNIIVEIIILIILILSALVIFLLTKNNENTQKNAPELLKEWENAIMDDEASIQSVKKALNNDIYSDQLLFGKDSYLELYPTTKEENLTAYKTMQKKYVQEVQNMIRDNYDYQEKESVKSESGDVIVNFFLKTYNYSQYLDVLYSLQCKLLIKAGYEESQLKKVDNIDLYKSKIIGMQIMSEHLNDFIDNNYYEMQIVFDNENGKLTSTLVNNYLAMLQGNYQYQINSLSEEERVNINNKITELSNSYIENASVKTNPLEI